MGSKKHRRSRSRSGSRDRDRSRGRNARSRSPEDSHGRNRRRDRSDSSGDSARPSRHRGRESGHSSDSDREQRGRGARSRGRSKERDCSPSDSRSDHKKHKKKTKHKDEKNSRRKSRSSSRSSTESGQSKARDGRSSSERENRRRPSRSPTRERRRSRERRDHDRRGKRSDSAASSSSSSSADSDRERKNAQGTASGKEDKKKQKDMMKALETPEEKRTRRLAKKEAKERKKREKMGWSEEYMGYTNADNPFGDNNLLGTFKWQKALVKKGIGHLSEKELKERNKLIQEENRRELQKVKQLRLEREREKSMRELELEMLQREKEAEHFKTWAEQEDNFHLHQAKLRSKIRIRDGRAKPIDLLAKYISAEDDDLSVEMHEPYTFLNGLTATDMEDLLEDIKVYMELEQGKNVDFWRDMTTITEDEIGKLRKLETSGKGPGDRREGINTSVSTDVQSVFKGKTYSQLQALYMNIENKIQAGGTNLDIGYWESLLQQVRVYMARARLRERHQDVLRQKLFKLKQEQGVESEPLFPIIKEEPGNERQVAGGTESSHKETGSPQQGTSRMTEDREKVEKRLKGGESERSGRSSPQEKREGEGGEDGGEGGEKGEAPEAVLTEEDLIQQSQAEYDSGRYSPTLLQNSELPLDTHVTDVDEDMQRLHLARRQMQVTGDANESAEDAFVRLAKEGMGGDEAQFSVEMPLTGKMYLWADKYRPRKPRFFNRVHTGFEWNKYNQTHYDFDNPPPKIVQGYKFNIFYPDLIDKRSTPQYFLEPSLDNKDFGILRFHAGPPYEDIAFKIVNREWEYSHRHGFRCQFSNGIFQLWFHFKRYRYRR
ncbi:splicing factor Cactin [Triplophysa dalaica]|uniref:splicing factor Cactin n=1 Tax=Triplophysa dalaica TaxID=1582913 RepID=UPI0024DF82B5|nr:splicing factor Cactin [Triplophysa dalaica]